MPKQEDPTQTLVVDNFQGDMTIYNFGNINSGLSNIFITGGNNPFLRPGQLTWNVAAEQIDPNGSVITDLILDMKGREESGVHYMYAIGHTGRLYKIQVNDPNTYNPDYDNPVLLTTLTAQSPTFTRGGFIDFFGSIERIYIGHDKGVTRVDFNGANETFVGSVGSWTQNVPRPFKQFVGKLYIGNGSNIAEIDSTATVTSYTKLSPGFPANTQVRDMDFSVDGNYLEMIVTRLALPDITATTQDTTSTANSDSYNFKWNGTDQGYTTFDTYPSFSLFSNHTFQDYQYVFGYDLHGMAIFNPTQKVITEPEAVGLLPNAITSYGNILSWMEPLYFEGVLIGLNNIYGPLDHLVGGSGYHSMLVHLATGTETDIVRIPCQIQVSNFGLGSSSNNYPNNVFGSGKIYFSTLETSSAPTTKYKLYKWKYVPSPEVPATSLVPAEFASYQTQTQMFSKRVRVKEVRIYGNPWANNVSFQIDLIGPDGNPIDGASFIFGTSISSTTPPNGSTPGQGPLQVGDDFAWFNPKMDRSYALGLRITNIGTANHVINKCEIDYAAGGE